MLGNMYSVAWIGNSRNGVAIKDCFLPNACSSALPEQSLQQGRQYYHLLKRNGKECVGERDQDNENVFKTL